MNNENAIQLTDQRINALGLYLAEFSLDFVPVDSALNKYDANDFLALFDAWFTHFLRYAETNIMFEAGEKEALTLNHSELVSYIKDAAVDAAREIIMEKI